MGLQQSLRNSLGSAVNIFLTSGTRTSGVGGLSLCLLSSTASEMNFFNNEPFRALGKGMEECMY